MAIEKITVLYGGESSERSISLESGKYVFQSVKHLGYEAELVDYPNEFLPEKCLQGDFVFIALHGQDGESGELQSFLQQNNIPYTGSGYEACKNTWNKDTFKKILRENGIPTPNWISVPSLDKFKGNLDDSIFDQFRPFNEIFLKPTEDGSSIDVFKLSTNNDLKKAISDSLDSKRQFIFEESIDFKELTVPILNGKCLPPLEIITKESFYNFNAKYVNEDTELIEFIISDKKKIELEQICLKTLNIVKASGWLRVDLMQDSNQNFYVLEVNTVPGMTSHSLFPKSAESIGLSYDELVNEIINAEI